MRLEVVCVGGQEAIFLALHFLLQLNVIWFPVLKFRPKIKKKIHEFIISLAILIVEITKLVYSHHELLEVHPFELI